MNGAEGKYPFSGLEHFLIDRITHQFVFDINQRVAGHDTHKKRMGLRKSG